MTGQNKLALVNDGDEIELGLADSDEYGDIFTLLNAWPEKTILFRPRRHILEACREQRAYVARLRRKNLVVGTLLFVHSDDGSQEVASLYIHPQLRGLNIPSWLIPMAIVHRIAAQNYDYADCCFFAKVLAGNHGPHCSLVGSGFRRDERIIEIDPAAFAGAIDHMVENGEKLVRAYRYNFLPEDLDRIILKIFTFIKDQGAEERRGCISIRFLFNLKALTWEALEAHARWVATTSLLPTETSRLSDLPKDKVLSRKITDPMPNEAGQTVMNDTIEEESDVGYRESSEFIKH